MCMLIHTCLPACLMAAFAYLPARLNLCLAAACPPSRPAVRQTFPPALQPTRPPLPPASLHARFRLCVRLTACLPSLLPGHSANLRSRVPAWFSATARLIARRTACPPALTHARPTFPECTTPAAFGRLPPARLPAGVPAQPRLSARSPAGPATCPITAFSFFPACSLV